MQKVKTTLHKSDDHTVKSEKPCKEWQNLCDMHLWPSPHCASRCVVHNNADRRYALANGGLMASDRKWLSRTNPSPNGGSDHGPCTAA